MVQKKQRTQAVEKKVERKVERRGIEEDIYAFTFPHEKNYYYYYYPYVLKVELIIGEVVH